MTEITVDERVAGILSGVEQMLWIDGSATEASTANGAMCATPPGVVRSWAVCRPGC
jgi:hypothetical protein